MTRHGWLSRNPEIARNDAWFGVHLQPSLPTRWEEFSLAREAAQTSPPGLALDAGSGVTPSQHILPLILASLGWRVVALDRDPASAEMPAPAGVSRLVADMCDLPLADASVDAVFSISVLEHVGAEDRARFAAEAARVAKSGALLLVTADALPPAELAAIFSDGFECGQERLFAGAHLSPKVGYLVARRRTG